MKMIRNSLAATAAILLSLSAHATDKQHPPKPQPRPEVTHNPVQVSTGSMATAGSSSWSNAGGGSASAAGGSVTSAYESGNFYMLPAPVMAAPLPANLCPQGDSLAWSIGWNFFSYSRSSTRTELECLEKVLTIIRAQQPAMPTLAPLTDAERAQLALLEAPKPPACPAPAPAKRIVKAKPPADGCKRT